MAKLRTLQPRVKVLRQSIATATPVSVQRVTGRALQRRRLELWTAGPVCAMCGRVVEYPGGFELDHKLALEHGGDDSAGNCQLLCIHVEIIDGQRVKTGCHVNKTAEERKV
jgi:5-methylcytosine-specific restriction protein A